MKNILIYSKSFRNANYWLEQLIKDIPYGKVKKYDARNGRAELVDGTVYYAISDEQGMRGRRFDEVHIPIGTKTQFIFNNIYPVLNLKHTGETQIFYF